MTPEKEHLQRAIEAAEKRLQEAARLMMSEASLPMWKKRTGSGAGVLLLRSDDLVFPPLLFSSSCALSTQIGAQEMQTNPIDQARKPERLLRLPAVEQLTGLKKSTIYAGLNATPRTFPAPVRLSTRAVAWRESDIAAWQATRQQTGGGK